MNEILLRTLATKINIIKDRRSKYEKIWQPKVMNE